MPLSRPQLLALEDKLLVGASDADAFVSDYYPNVHHQFGNV